MFQCGDKTYHLGSIWAISFSDIRVLVLLNYACHSSQVECSDGLLLHDALRES